MIFDPLMDHESSRMDVSLIVVVAVVVVVQNGVSIRNSPLVWNYYCIT